MGKGAKWTLGIVVAVLIIIAIRLYQLYDKLVILTGVSGVKISKGNLVVDTNTRLKNPTASSLVIKPPFVTVTIGGEIIASSNIPANPKPIKIGALAETAVPAQIELPLASIPKLLKNGQKVQVNTYIRFGPFGAFNVTQKEEITLNLPI